MANLRRISTYADTPALSCSLNFRFRKEEYWKVSLRIVGATFHILYMHDLLVGLVFMHVEVGKGGEGKVEMIRALKCSGVSEVCTLGVV